MKLDADEVGSKIHLGLLDYRLFFSLNFPAKQVNIKAKRLQHQLFQGKSAQKFLFLSMWKGNPLQNDMEAVYVEG